MVKLTIDGQEVTAEPGKKLIEVTKYLGIEIPHYCFHPALDVAGSCRLCMVEVVGAPKPLIACNTAVNEGMVVHTDTDKVRKARQDVLEFLLLNHPLDCPVCDKAGECSLQDYTFKHGNAHSRFTEPKRIPPFKDLGPNIKHATTRCVLCTRCVRFMDQIAGEHQLAVFNRGSHDEISVHPEEKLDHPLAGNVVDICPVGCLLDKNFMHRTRVWHLKKKQTVCGECSAGCNINVETHEDEIFRITPRANMDVNTFWICDTGRYSNKKHSEIDRISAPMVKGNSDSVTWEEASRSINAGFAKFTKTKDSIAGLASPTALNEEVFALREYLKNSLNSTAITGLFEKPVNNDVSFKGGFTIKGDRFPNQTGLRIVIGPDTEDGSILSKIESGKIKAAYVIKNDIADIPQTILDVLKKLDFLVVETITESPLSKMAHVVLPGMYYLEKTGTFVNFQSRLQLLKGRVAGPDGTKNTIDILKMIAPNGKNKLKLNSANDLFIEMSKKIDKFENLTHFKIGDQGISLNENKAVTV